MTSRFGNEEESAGLVKRRGPLAASHAMSEVEETLNRIKTHKGVSGIVIVRRNGCIHRVFHLKLCVFVWVDGWWGGGRRGSVGRHADLTIHSIVYDFI